MKELMALDAAIRALKTLRNYIATKQPPRGVKFRCNSCDAGPCTYITEVKLPIRLMRPPICGYPGSGTAEWSVVDG